MSIKNIVFISDYAYITGGVGQVAVNTALELKSRGYDVYFFAAMDMIDESLIQQQIEVHTIGLTHIAKEKSISGYLANIWNNKSKQELNNYLKNFNPENTIIHVHSWTKALSSSIFQSIYQSGFKCIITLHDYFTVCPNGGLYIYKKNIFCNHHPGSLKCISCNCDKQNYCIKVFRLFRWWRQSKILRELKPAIIFVSNFSKNLVQDRISFNPSKQFTIPNFCSFENKERVKCENNKYALFLGRVDVEKGVDVFCKAVTIAGVPAVVVGSGVLVEKYKDMYPNIEFVGWKSGKELEDYINNSRYLIISSKLYETMGLTAIEMKSFGVPIIVSNNTAASEYVVNDGDLFELNDLSSLIACINKYKSDDVVKQMSLNAYYNFNKEPYLVKNHIDKLIESYQETMGVCQNENK